MYGKVSYVQPMTTGNRTGTIQGIDGQSYGFDPLTVLNHPGDPSIIGKYCEFNVPGFGPVTSLKVGTLTRDGNRFNFVPDPA